MRRETVRESEIEKMWNHENEKWPRATATANFPLKVCR